MNKEKIMKHFVAIGGGTAVVLLINLITVPLITRLVDPSEYGIQSVFTMYGSLAASLFFMGQDQSLLRFFYLKENEEYKRTLLYRCIKYPLFLCITLNLLILLISLMNIVKIDYGLWGAAGLCVYITILVMDRFASLLLRVSYKTKQFSIVNITSRLSYLIISIGLIFTINGHNSVILILATMISAALSVTLNILVQKESWNFSKSHNDIDCPSTIEIFKYGVPFIIANSVGALFSFTDKMVIHMYRTYEEVGIYSSALGMVSVFSIIQTTFCTLWSPLTLEHYERDPEDTSFYIKGHNIITVIVFAAGLTMILGKDIFVVFLGEKYREASCLLPFLLFNPIMWTVSETTVSGLYFAKKANMQILPPLMACIVNFIGNIILVPRLGCQGAAISTGISYIIFFTIRTILGCRYYYIGFNLKIYYLITLMTVLYAFYNTFIKFNVFTVIGYLICILCLILFYKQTIKEVLKMIGRR